jgi:sulfite reductase beta subunit-like hemoprotein
VTEPDRCPGVLRLHEAGDGLLARIRVPGGRLSADAISAIATATELGNGVAELTSRANVQVRGLHEAAETALLPLLTRAGLMPSPQHDRVRNVIASPFAGRHTTSVADTDSVVADLDCGLCAAPALAELSGRFLFAVDDGAGFALAPVADVTLHAEPGDRFRLALDGMATSLVADRRAAPGLALDAARAFMALARAGERRVRDLEAGAVAVARKLGAELGGVRKLGAELADVPRSQARVRPGQELQRDGRHALTGLAPLARLETGQLRVLAGLGALRLSSARTLTLLDVAEAELPAAQAALERAGLILQPGSGWEGLTACSGIGACVNAQFDVRAAAAIRAQQRRSSAAAEHWSACGRRCGQRARQPLGIVADGQRLTVTRGETVESVPDLDAALAALA